MRPTPRDFANWRTFVDIDVTLPLEHQYGLHNQVEADRDYNTCRNLDVNSIYACDVASRSIDLKQ